MNSIINKTVVALSIVFVSQSINAQTELITNGSFESNPWYNNWNFSAANGDLWGGSGSCTPYDGSKYVWIGDQNEDYGVDYGNESMYQSVTIPSNTVSCTLYFAVSINTEEGGSTAYDELEVSLKNASGSILTSFGTFDNTDGDYGIPGCQTWSSWYVVISSTYFGQTVRVAFDFATDSSNPTIFRLDDVSMVALTSNPCTYSLSQYNYTCPNATANTYGNITTVSTQTSCVWNANVTSGSSWLSTSSSGSGAGIVSITVSQNTGSARTGTIDINGEQLTVTQPAANCTYSLSSNSYTLLDHTANTYTNFVIVNTQTGCDWSAVVTSASNWIITSSSGTGSGAISVTVVANTTATARIASIDVNGQTLLITQPGDWHLTGLNEPLNSKLNVFPNPAVNQLNIAVEAEQIGANFMVIDVTGKVQMAGTFTQSNSTMDVSALSSGLYMIVLDDALRSSITFVKE